MLLKSNLILGLIQERAAVRIGTLTEAIYELFHPCGLVRQVVPEEFNVGSTKHIHVCRGTRCRRLGLRCTALAGLTLAHYPQGAVMDVKRTLRGHCSIVAFPRWIPVSKINISYVRKWTELNPSY